MLSFRSKLVIGAASIILASMAIPISFAFAQWIEATHFPVMRYFGVTRTDRVEGGQVLSGEMFKERDCRTLQMTAYDTKNELLTVEFLADPKGTPIKSRATGHQTFYGIKVSPDAPIVRHSCHSLWDSITNLTALPDSQAEVDAIKGGK